MEDWNVPRNKISVAWSPWIIFLPSPTIFSSSHHCDVQLQGLEPVQSDPVAAIENLSLLRILTGRQFSSTSQLCQSPSVLQGFVKDSKSFSFICTSTGIFPTHPQVLATSAWGSWPSNLTVVSSSIPSLLCYQAQALQSRFSKSTWGVGLHNCADHQL